MMFVDTSAWYALFVPSDPNHGHAVQVVESNDQPFVTTDYVIGELLTLLVYRRERGRIGPIVTEFVERQAANIVWTTEADFHSAIKTMLEFKDKEWSFTDCLSRVVIHRLGIRTAFAFDDDFRQFGNICVVPNVL